MNLTFPDSEYPHRACPFMSGQVVPVGQSTIVRGSQEIAMSPVFVPCMGDRCQLWDGSRCAVAASAPMADVARYSALRDVIGNVAVELGDCAESLRSLVPASTGSPVSRLCDLLEKLIQQRAAK